MKNQTKKPANALQKPWTRTPAIKHTKHPKQAIEEVKAYGENACRVLFQERPEAIIKLYLSPKTAPKFSDLMKYLAANKKAYHIVEEQELEKISGSSHHGGIVLLVKRKEITLLGNYLQRKVLKQDCLLALDGVSNSHNLGAICRTAAHFGINGILMTKPELLQSGAALRVAEGGGEFIEGLKCDSLPLALKLLQDNGYSLITTSSHNGTPLYKSVLPKKSVIIFGEEMFGVSENVAKNSDIAINITGTGKVESLNVSVAASLILGEWYRQNTNF